MRKVFAALLKRMDEFKKYESMLCPFHEEKTPSFNVDKKTGDFFCFGCGEEGNVHDSSAEIQKYVGL
jgi:DNA primase